MAVLMHPKYFAHYRMGRHAGDFSSGRQRASRTAGKCRRCRLASRRERTCRHRSRVNNKWRLQYPIGKVLLEGEGWMSDMRVSPDGKQVALFRHPPNVDDRGDLVLVDRSGQLRTLSTGWESLEGLAWAPSGKEIWFSAAETGEQWCIHAISFRASRGRFIAARRRHAFSTSRRRVAPWFRRRKPVGRWRWWSTGPIRNAT